MKQENPFAKWVSAQGLNLDKFQSFVCWLIGITAILATIPPIVLVSIQGTRSQWGCQGVKFTILAHYRIYEWLGTSFNEFQNEITQLQNNGTITYDVCYRLVISDNSLFDESYSSSIWIPENYYWVDYAKTSSSEAQTINSEYCEDLTSIPLGIVTWKEFSSHLSHTTNVTISELVQLAKNGWSLTYNSTFSFAHGHPKVTSGGLFGIAAVFQNALNETSELILPSLSPTKLATAELELTSLENAVNEYGPNEKELMNTLLAHGPSYIQAIFGFENDVVYANSKYNSSLIAHWNDTLSFLYLHSSYWMTHPLCILKNASWMTDDNRDISHRFKQFVTGTALKNELLKYGIRPADYTAATLNNTIIKESFGGNPNVTEDNTIVYSYPTATTGSLMYDYFETVKKPVYLEILLDVSKSMSKTYTKNKIRWYYVSKSLSYFPNNLEGAAIIQISCFASSIFNCSSSPYPNGNLSVTKNDTIDYIKNDLTWKSIDKVNVFQSLNQTIGKIRAIKAKNTNARNYNYVIVVISEQDSTESTEDAETLLDTVGLNFSPDDIHIFPVLYFGSDASYTYTIFEEVAKRTNSEYYSAKSDIQDVLESITYYF